MEETKIVEQTITTGRKEILTQYNVINEDNIIEVIKETRKMHDSNATEINTLIDMYKGLQEILKREKPIRPEINNKSVVNYAMMITRIITGYFMSEPLKYTSLNPNIEIDELNNSLRNSGKDKVNNEIATYQSICGVGYKYMQYIDNQLMFTSLNPLNTYVIKTNDVFKEQIAGVTFIDGFNLDTKEPNTTYLVYVDKGYYKVTTIGEKIENGATIEYFNTGYSIPLIEYPNNMFRIGDFEPVVGILNLLNKTTNDRMNDVEQFVQNLLIFVNCELKDEKEYDLIRKKGFLTLINKMPNGGNCDIKTINETLDQNGLQTFVDNLKSMLFEIVGIPDRKTRGGGSGDTGSAVELRDGWQDLEIVARNKQVQFNYSEKRALNVALQILHNIKDENVDIELRDIEIKFNRNKNSNLLVKTNSLSTLLGTKTITPEEAYKIVDILNDVEEEMKKGMEFWGDEFANKVKEVEETINVEETKEVVPSDNEGNDNYNGKFAKQG